MPAELILLGTAGAPLPVPGRRGISSALVVGDRVFVIDCGRGAPSAYADAGLDFRQLDSVFLTHLHADHIGDLPGLLLYPWGVRAGCPPISVHGPARPRHVGDGEGPFMRQTTIRPDVPAPGTHDLVAGILHTFAYHLNVMPLDATMPDAGALARGLDITLEPGQGPVVVLEDDHVRVRAVLVTHGHAMPALAYRFDTPDGSVAFSGDTTVNDALIDLASGAAILVHQVADLAYLQSHGTSPAELSHMAGLHTDVTQVGGVAERAGVGELILSHYLPAGPDTVPEAAWVSRASEGFSGTTTAGHDGLRRTLTR
jgi:ribonuclease BN (tRNA processing enzyme)